MVISEGCQSNDGSLLREGGGVWCVEKISPEWYSNFWKMLYLD